MVSMVIVAQGLGQSWLGSRVIARAAESFNRNRFELMKTKTPVAGPGDSAGPKVSDSGCSDPRRGLPSVGRLLVEAQAVGLVEEYGREQVTVQAQQLLAALRSDPGLTARSSEPSEVQRALGVALAAAARPLSRVINATGVFLHTNLGRAPLPEGVISSLGPLLDAGCDLEVDLQSGKRGDRNHRVNDALCALTGASAAVVVNNNAAALVLALKTLAAGKEVIVSRGELVEIGGSFRIPDILSGAGSLLVEVGTTNRTRAADYEAAINAQTGLLLKVYPSNYRIRGFTEEAPIEALVALSRKHAIPLLVDEGSGLLRSRPEAVFRGHASIDELLTAGCDLVCGSGDKVLGGAQAGLLLGSEELVSRCRRNPLYRALRPSRLVLIALGAVLELHQRNKPLPLDGLFVDEADHKARLGRLVDRFRSRLQSESASISIVPGTATVGGGSAPDREIPGLVLAVRGSQSLADALRTGAVPVVGRMHAGQLILDLRTVAPGDDSTVLEALLESLEALAVQRRSTESVATSESSE